MENNETMMNNEVIERAEETTNGGSIDGRKVAIGVGLTALVGAIVYKKVIKPKFNKLIKKVVAECLKDQAQEAQFEECCEEIPEEK